MIKENLQLPCLAWSGCRKPIKTLLISVAVPLWWIRCRWRQEYSMIYPDLQISAGISTYLQWSLNNDRYSFADILRSPMCIIYIFTHLMEHSGSLSVLLGIYEACMLPKNLVVPDCRCTVESQESRKCASDDFLEPAQSRLSICLSCSNLAFSVPSCWFGCLSSTLFRFSAIPTFIRFYSYGTCYLQASPVTGGCCLGPLRTLRMVWSIR